MAVEKGLVLAAIELKLKGKSLSKNFKENIATKWAEKIETEDDIDNYIEDREDILLEASSEADRRAVAAAKKAKESKVETPGEEDEKKRDEDVPAWAKALTEKITALETQQKSKTLNERFRSDDRIKSLKGVQEHMFKGRIPKSEDEYDAAVDEFVNDWKPYLEKTVLQGQGDDTPGGGTPPKKKGEVKQISKEEAEKVVSQMNI